MELCSPFPKANQECKEEKQREESNMKKSKRIETVGIILNTFWSPFHVYYISFRSLGSQKSNALNGAQIRAEMKKLWPLEDNRTKLKGNFASCESQSASCEMEIFSLWNFCNMWNRKRKGIVAGQRADELHEIFATCEMDNFNLRNPPEIWDICIPTPFDIYLNIFVYKSLFYPCNPPMTSFLGWEVSRRGE